MLPPLSSLRPAVGHLGPGVMVSVLVSLAAYGLSQRYTMPLMLIALLLGMAMSFLGKEARFAPGLRLVSSTGLKLGVALMGLRVSLGQFASLGGTAFLTILVGSVTTLLIGVVLGKRLGLSRSAALISAGAVAICGASAALAFASVTRDFKGKAEHTLLVILSATTLSSLAMIFYPLLLSYLGVDLIEQGVVLGASIHDVAQVVGAGFSVSEVTGETAVMAKMVRIILLPLLLVIVVGAGQASDTEGGRSHLPWFVVVFFGLMVLSQLFSVPVAIKDSAQSVCAGLLVAAVAALGVLSDPKRLYATGRKVFGLMLGLSGWLLLVAVVGATH